jgi:hypothetical protein
VAATASDPVYERLAYEAAQRALDKQERPEIVVLIVMASDTLF